ncbi:MAG: hypothetical protein LBD85_03655 [Oscillospiraceae bacterium]|jgi:transcription antitermination factor NusG|nr:hypothetical protein [Oscillospiraceae bacterium]
MDNKRELTRRFARHANWYILFVQTLKEQDVRLRLTAALPADQYVVFLPTKVFAKKKDGERMYVRKPIFAGYVFVAAEQDESAVFAAIDPLVRRDDRVYRFLSEVRTITDEDGKDRLHWHIRLPDQDKLLLDTLLDGDYNIPAFDAIRVGDRIELAPGHILEGFANNIVLKSVNRHRGTGIIEFDLFGKTRREEVALNVTG